jgi:hypothetical protein
MDIQLCPNLQHPFTCLVSGMTQSGKSKWVQKLINTKPWIIEPSPERIVYCYSEYQPDLFQQYDDKLVKFHQGLPNENEINEWFQQQPSLLVLDDLMQETDNKDQGKLVSSLFTRGSHHRNLSVILIVQNLFHQNRYFRTISLNSSYIVVFKNPRDANQIDHLGRQMFPGGKSKIIHDAYRRATERPHGYLFLDLKQTTPESARLRTNIFDEMKTGTKCEVFVPI